MKSSNVTVKVNNQTVGTLYPVRAGIVSRYADEWLSSDTAYELFPQLPLSPTSYSFKGIGPFTDSAPDRWGRMLLRHADNTRSLSELDYLLGVNDSTRQGSLRFYSDDQPVAGSNGVPTTQSLPALLNTADAIDRGEKIPETALRRLFNASGSLGGARPKVSIVDRGQLWMAKFPRSVGDEWDVIGWEAATLSLLEKADIPVPPHKLISITIPSGELRTILLTRRFDRVDGKLDGTRIGYMSALTAFGVEDGASADWIDIVDFITNSRLDAKYDLQRLWKTVVFGTAIGNTDNHLRNIGFLHTQTGWKLSPVFDVNPTPSSSQTRFLTTLLGSDTYTVSDLVAPEVLSMFDITKPFASKGLSQIKQVLESAHSEAYRAKINSASQELMLPRFQQGVDELAEAQKLVR